MAPDLRGPRSPSGTRRACVPCVRARLGARVWCRWHVRREWHGPYITFSNNRRRRGEARRSPGPSGRL